MQDLWSLFFTQKTVFGLREFLQTLDVSSPPEAALSYYAHTWFDTLSNSDEAVFNPREYLSEDLSAIMFGRCPVIFMGTNRWAEKTYRESSQHEEPMSKMILNLKRLREIYKNQRIVIAVVPEKDYVINSMFIGCGRYGEIDKAVEIFKREIAKLDMVLIFNSPLKGLNNYMEIGDFEYPDTHLTGRNYIQFFSGISNAFELNRTEIDEQLSMERVEVYGDLFGRFSSLSSIPEHTFVPHYPNAMMTLADGFKSFGSPLSSTWQRIFNENPIADEDVLILGDSHASILDQRRLTYLVSGAFRRTEFYWNPCGVRKEVPETTAKYAIMEISCRFLF
jgi:pentatricopeptide repeat protein